MLPVLKIKRLTDTAVLPKKMSEEAAGLDVWLDQRVILFANETKFAHTGIAIACPKGYHAELHIRSSLGSKGIRLANCTGIIDSDYRGEVLLAIHNDNKDPVNLDAQTRVAQIILVKDPNFEIKEVEDLNKTKRGVGGFGSTDKKEEE